MKIDDSLYLSNANKVREGNPTLDKDAFLKILMTQLQNQDPLSPMEDKDFIAQMASFTQLEQMTNMSTNFEKLLKQSSLTNFLQYSNLIGKEVTYFAYENGEYVGEVNAKVQSVLRADQDIILRLDNGKEIYSDQVFQVEKVNEEVSKDEPSN
ncbi:flagellar hook assembly protein FlgD [Bacillaceae bacterium W0354]